MAFSSRRRRPSSGFWAFIAQYPALAVFAVAGLVLLVLGRTQDDLVQTLRGLADDASAQVMQTVAGPASEGKKWIDGASTFLTVFQENQRLKDENAKLRAAQGELAELQRKVARYEQLLKIPEDATVTSVAGRVIADTTGPFLRTILLNTGSAQGVEKGHAVVDDKGLLGRVIGVGQRSSRVLLLSDINSRIPVIIEGANLKAILVGDNTDRPTLEYLPSGSRLVAGQRVVTTADGAALPPGIAIGTVMKGETMPRVQLYTSEGRADFVRVLHYHVVNDVDPEAVPGAVPGTPPSGAATAPPAVKPSSGPGTPSPIVRPPALMRY
jgi:rod shape-determining protein MreC